MKLKDGIRVSAVNFYGDIDLVLRGDGGVATFYQDDVTGTPTYIWGAKDADITTTTRSYHRYKPENFYVYNSKTSFVKNTPDSGGLYNIIFSPSISSNVDIVSATLSLNNRKLCYFPAAGTLFIYTNDTNPPLYTDSTTVCTNLNADLLDGTHKTDLFTTLANSNNLLSITVGETNKKLTVAYASTAGSISFNNMPTMYWADLVVSSTSNKLTVPTIKSINIEHSSTTYNDYDKIYTITNTAAEDGNRKFVMYHFPSEPCGLTLTCEGGGLITQLRYLVTDNLSSWRTMNSVSIDASSPNSVYYNIPINDLYDWYNDGTKANGGALSYPKQLLVRILTNGKNGTLKLTLKNNSSKLSTCTYTSSSTVATATFRIPAIRNTGGNTPDLESCFDVNDKYGLWLYNYDVHDYVSNNIFLLKPYLDQLHQTKLIFNGTISATTVTQSSDVRLKSNIKDVVNVSAVDKIKIKLFTFNENPSIVKYGVVALELEQVGFNNLVINDEYKSVDYISLLCLKIAYLEKEIEKLKKINLINMK